MSQEPPAPDHGSWERQHLAGELELRFRSGTRRRDAGAPGVGSMLIPADGAEGVFQLLAQGFALFVGGFARNHDGFGQRDFAKRKGQG
jgi:hypothetical protein